MDEMLARAQQFLGECLATGPEGMAAFARSECLLQMEADCKLICHWCREGKPLLEVGGFLSKHSLPDDGRPDLYPNMAKVTVVSCNADLIREAMRKLQAEMEATR